MNLLPSLPGDPDGWVRVDIQNRYKPWDDEYVPVSELTPLPTPPHSSFQPKADFKWLIRLDGRDRKVSVSATDFTILDAALEKKKIFEGGNGCEIPLNCAINRLHELTGPGDPPTKAPESK